MTRATAFACAVLFLAACGTDEGPSVPWDGISYDADGDATDMPLDGSDGLDTVDVPADTVDVDTDPLPTTCPEKSYIWIANSLDGTLSKLCTLTGEEMGRYYTSPQESAGDPSRTSVNLHGDMVVTNRDPTTGPSSVTKFAAERSDCVDMDGDGIETSTGPDDIKPWGEDECMVWNTTLPDAGSTMAMGCRATAWDGAEDPDTGEGGHVWIGCMMNQKVYVLDGDSGMILNPGGNDAGVGPYGGAMDGRGNFWMVAMTCTVMLCRVSRMDMTTFATEVFNVPCGYGISVDRLGRVWTAGMGCVNRLDPLDGTNTTLSATGGFNRGIAVDGEGSVWAAVTGGSLLRVSEDAVTLLDTIPLSASEVVGVAIDFQGNVWAISNGSDKALKYNPTTDVVEDFPIGDGPYTYSDMTGYQLSIVEIPI